MILTSHSIGSIGKTIDYCLQPTKISNVLHSDGLDLTGLSLDNSQAHDTSIVKDEFLIYQNSRLQKPYLSLIISPEEDLTPDTLRAIVNDTLKEMELDNHQMIAITHEELRGDVENLKLVKHVHVLINRVDYDGKTYNDKFIGLKGIKAISKVSQKYNLRDVYHTRVYDDKPSTKKNSDYHSEKFELIGVLKGIVEPLLKLKTTQTVDDIFDVLINEHFVDVNITQYKNGRFGVSLKKDGCAVNASDVSRYITVKPNGDSYTANNLLQPILDENIKKSSLEIHKSMDEIQSDFLVHGDMELMHSQLIAYNIFTKTSMKDRSDRENDEKEAEFLRKKHGKGPKQIGFKVQI